MTAVGKREAIVPREVVDRLLAASAGLVLVGGQALKVWMDRYEVTLPPRIAYVSRDVDFLAASASDAASVRRLASALGGRTVFPRRRAALTALVGQAVKDLSEEEVFNVDVLHRVFGADDGVRSRAVEVRLAKVTFRVMHPLDVLKSRVDNLAGLREKQNELGEAQLRAAILVARAFQREAAASESARRTRRPTTLRYAGFIEHLALGAAGRKLARRYGLHVADAIEPGTVPSRELLSAKLPRLAKLMSAERRGELGLS
ncbi:MAG: hypothetical protein KF850_06425 [Labilithrix sp.]|nr:hypothetical protein [Labilithrix sp.]MBX3211650.1 hypothetical protein [Labilithrix sp.]